MKKTIKKIKEKYGPWALITGATSGIGLEFTKQLGKIGLNLVLVSRNKNLLDDMVRLMEKQYSVQVKTIAIDLTQEGFIEDIRKTTDDLNIGLLINNAGLWKLGDYLDITLKDELKMIDLNIKAPAVLTHHFAPKMVAEQKGGIINVASMLGYLGVPYSTAYAASKAYEVVKSEGLWYELKKQGVDVLSLNPGLTKTAMISDYDFSHMPIPPLNPEKVVKTSLMALGKKSQVIPGKMNKILGVLSKRVMSRDMNTKMFGLLIGKANNKLKKTINHL